MLHTVLIYSVLFPVLNAFVQNLYLRHQNTLTLLSFSLILVSLFVKNDIFLRYEEGRTGFFKVCQLKEARSSLARTRKSPSILTIFFRVTLY